MKQDEIFSHHSVETVILNKHATEYEQMRKRIVEFLSKFQGRGIQISRVNSIRVSKLFVYLLLVRVCVNGCMCVLNLLCV